MTAENDRHKLVVIGAGPGGYAAAFRAADLGMPVTLIDPRENPGGVCLYEGCIPTKALLHASGLLKEARAAGQMGISFKNITIESARIKEWKDGIVKDMTEGLGKLAQRRNVNYIRGTARFTGRDKLEISFGGSKKNREILFEHAIIATGSAPLGLPGTELPPEFMMDAGQALNLENIPKKLLIIGAGYIGMEMSTIYHMLGSEISLVELQKEILPGTDTDLVKIYEKENRNIFREIFMESRVTSAKEKKGAVSVRIKTPEKEVTRTYDKILVAIGRAPFTENLGLENTGISLTEENFIQVDEFRRTGTDNIYAIGDVTGEPLLAHKATHEGLVAAETICGEKMAFEPNAIPAVIYTDPEIAWAGLTEEEAKAANLDVVVSKFPWEASGRAKTMNAVNGITKLIIDKSTDRILGVAIAGKHAGELIAEGALAIEMASLATDLAYTIHPHPTLSETLMEAADALYGQSVNIYKPRKKKQ